MADIYSSSEDNSDYDPNDYDDEWDDLEEPNGTNGAVHPDDRTEEEEAQYDRTEEEEEQYYEDFIVNGDFDPIPF